MEPGPSAQGPATLPIVALGSSVSVLISVCLAFFFLGDGPNSKPHLGLGTLWSALVGMGEVELSISFSPRVGLSNSCLGVPISRGLSADQQRLTIAAGESA